MGRVEQARAGWLGRLDDGEAGRRPGEGREGVGEGGAGDRPEGYLGRGVLSNVTRAWSLPSPARALVPSKATAPSLVSHHSRKTAFVFVMFSSRNVFFALLAPPPLSNPRIHHCVRHHSEKPISKSQ